MATTKKKAATATKARKPATKKTATTAKKPVPLTTKVRKIVEKEMARSGGKKDYDRPKTLAAIVKAGAKNENMASTYLHNELRTLNSKGNPLRKSKAK